MSDQDPKPSWLAEARQPYLDFLAHLASPVLLGTFAGVLLIRTSSATQPLLNAGRVLFAAVFLGAALIAFLANASLLNEKLFKRFYKRRAQMLCELKAQGLRGAKLNTAFVKVMLADSRMCLHAIAILLLLFVLMAILAGVMISASTAAAALVSSLDAIR